MCSFIKSVTDYRSISVESQYTGSELFLTLGLLDNLLDNLLFFNEESSNNSFLNTVSTSRPTVSSGDGLLGLGDRSVSSWSQSCDTGKCTTTVTTLWSGCLLLDVLSNKSATWGLDNLDLVRLSVVCNNL